MLTQWRPRLALFPVSPIVEAALIGAICGFAMDNEKSVVLLALAIPPFVAGVHLGGVRSVAQSLSAELVAVVSAPLCCGSNIGSPTIRAWTYSPGPSPGSGWG